MATKKFLVNTPPHLFAESLDPPTANQCTMFDKIYWQNAHNQYKSVKYVRAGPLNAEFGAKQCYLIVNKW